jgi:tetratricopeptide (TPR) repeat protein
LNLKAVKLDLPALRAALYGAAAAIVAIAVFTFVWCFANTGSYNAEFKEVGDLFAWLSPSDPQTHFAAASLHESALESGDFEAAVREYEAAASLAPDNYLLWLRLAAIRGRAGDTPGTEAALRRAEQLAPNYSRSQWAMGNFLLREGRDEEAYPQLQKAVAGDVSLAPLAAATALQTSDGDAEAVIRKFQNSTPVTVAVAIILVSKKEFDKAIEIWNRVEPIDDDVYPAAAKQIRRALVDGKLFKAAVSMKGPPDLVSGSAFEKLTNPGFESPIRTQEADAFDWTVTQGAYPQTGVTDSQKVSGAYGLIILLGGQDQKDFRGISQIVAVQPGASYEFGLNYRTDVRSVATFQWEIASANDQHRIALSQPLTPSQNWTRSLTKFTVPTDTDGIIIRFVRNDCTASTCNATGTFWFDDLSLTRK